MTNAAARYRQGGATIATIVDPRFGIGPNPTQPAGWGGSTVVQPGEGSAVEVFIPPSGDTSGATDLANIQAAIDAATEPNPADTSQITNVNNHFTQGLPVDIRLLGKYTINGPIILKQGCRLIGSGWMASTVHLAPGSNSSMVIVPDRAYWIGIQDIHFDGHGEEQTDDGTLAALDISPGGAVTVRGDSCTVPFIYRVMVSYARGDAFKLSGVELRTQNCYAYRAKRYGFNISASDMWVNDCMSGDSGKSGFYIAGGQHHISNCKSWWSGYYQADRTKLASKASGPSEPGFDVRGGGNMIVNCDAQDSSGVGWRISQSRNYLRNVVSDSSRGGHFLLYGAAAGCIIQGHCASVHADVAPFALKIESWAATQGNRVEIDFDAGIHNGTPLTTKGVEFSGNIPDVTDGAVLNVVRIGTPERTFTTTYAATITPDPLRGGVAVTLTGNVTIANTVPDRSVHGTEISIMLTQDATGGRTVTWGSDYTGMTAADTGANKVNLWRIRRVKNRWVQVGFVSY